jgi:phosphatidylinositol-3-phosphatase
VLVIMLENKGYSATLGMCSADPYFCSLASKYASFTNSHGVSHPSEPNYVAFESGGIQGCTSDTSCAAFSVNAGDLGGQLSAKGVPWVSWQESMPSACYTGQTFGDYALKHSFGGFFTADKTPCRILPYPGSASAVATLTGASAPDFVWITPNQLDDMHSASVTAGDNWLRANLAPILASGWFTGFQSTVIVTMDEGDSGGSNQIPTVVISNSASGKGAVTTSINHYAVLRAIEESFGLGLLGGASTAPGIVSLFG